MLARHLFARMPLKVQWFWPDSLCQEDLSITHETCVGYRGDLARQHFRRRVPRPDADLDLGQKCEVVLAAPVTLQIVLLPTVSFHLINGARLDLVPGDDVEHGFRL